MLPRDARKDSGEAHPQLTLTGLEADVTVFRDRLGIAHARAQSTHDAFFAQGFIHAQDRIWHMDADRMRALGRWSEYVGHGGLEQDTLMRRLGLGRSARRDYAALGDAARAMLDAYSAGINAFLQSMNASSVEHQLLGVTPEAWEPWHCGAIYKLRHCLMGNAPYKLWRKRILDVAGEEWLLRLAGADQVGPGTRVTEVAEVEAGSNNWAIHGSRTMSGAPLVAGDPHRAIDVPNVYYQNHIACPDFDAIGLSFPGVPGFPHFGHNAQVCWCVTHAVIDNQDLFVERFSSEDPTRYAFRDEWRTAEVTSETVRVHNAEDVTIDVTRTHHGPVVLGDPASGEAIAMAYTTIAGEDRTFDAFLPMLRAASVRELDEAMRTWVEPGNNFVMADVHGDIGYLTRGQVPVRPRSNGWLPVPGSTGEHEWQGTVPFEEMPRMRNPEDGCIVTANNRIVGDEYPHFLSNDWRPAWRASRIRQVLEGRSGLCPEDMPAIHAETFSAVSRAYVDLAREITPGDDAIASARQILLDWDGRMEAGSRGAAIYAVWREMLNALIVDQPGLRGLADAAASHELLPGQALPVAARVRAPFYALMVERNPDVLPTGESWTSLGARALSEAVTWLGSDPSRWTWGRIHRTQPRHVLAGLFPDEADSLNPPSVGVGGDGDTPRAAAFRELTDDGFAISGSAVARYCFDLSDWDRSGWVVPLGGSGDPRSPHYADQVENWARVELYPMPYSAAAVEQAATERTELISARAVR